ncbi:MAG: response regulator [Ignavibacteria bacterium]
MKISVRILLINFLIVVLVFVSSTIAFYSLTRKILTSQHSRNLLNSAKDFAYTIQSISQETDEDFLKIISSNQPGKSVSIADTKVDFIFSVNSDSTINHSFFLIKPGLYTDIKFDRLSRFMEAYPNLLLKKYIKNNKTVFYFGRIINTELMDNIAGRIRADVSLFRNNVPIVTSNPATNQKLLLNIAQSARELLLKNNFDIAKEELANADFYATYYSPKELHFVDSNIGFLIFTTLPEAAELRDNINNILVIIGFTGIFLSLILVLIFTEKIRRQITQLSRAADITRGGDLKHRVSMLTKDELGSLGLVFNNMLDELERNQSAKNEYTEFITLINQNPTLKEVSEAALNKIIKATGFTVGRLFLIENGYIRLISSFGLHNELIKAAGINIGLYQTIQEKGEPAEFSFSDNLPKLDAGLVSLEVKYLLLYPVIYNKKVIAILELASVNELKAGVKEYLANIDHQLAIGLSNAGAFNQLENLVDELKKLNDDYLKQNEQITSQNKILLELHKQLEEKAEELEQQRGKAVESAMLKSQFLASMSHELKTPLNSILGLTELMLHEQPLNQLSHEKLEIVFRNGNRLMNLINDILNFSRLEAGRMEIQNENFRFSELTEEIKANIIPLLKSKEILFGINNFAGAEAAVFADKFKILQVLINLLSNAVKFTEHGNIELDINIPDDSSVSFEVSDTGIGISDSDKEIIFEEFRQLDGTSKRKYSGAGLGLAISRKYAELLNGTLICHSKPGKGSKFIFTIPVKFIQTELTDKVIPFSEYVPGIFSKSILVIDNDNECLNIVKQYFTLKGYKVDRVTGASMAMTAAEESFPIAIVINTRFEENSAWDILTELKKSELVKDIPVIMMALLEELNIGYGLNVYDFLLMPFEEKSVISSFNKLERLAQKQIRNIVYLGADEIAFLDIKEKLNRIGYKAEFIDNASSALRLVSKLQPDIILIDSLANEDGGMYLVSKLANSIDTMDIPVMLCINQELSANDKATLNSAVEKMAMLSKGNPRDILRLIRDKVYFEEGLTGKDVQEIFMDSSTDKNAGTRSDTPEKHKVLIVDDDTDTLFTVGEIVRRTGCETVFGHNGLECLSALQQYTPDLILLDIMMPLMDGFETIKRIRADKNISHIPVFALSALAMIEEKEIVIKNGFDDFIPKPVNPSLLAFKIEKILLNKSAKV